MALRRLIGLLAVVVLVAGAWIVTRHLDAVAERRAATEDAVALILSGTRHGVTGEVTQGVVALSGTFDTEREAADVLPRLAGLDGVVRVEDATTTLPLGAPYTLTLRQGNAGLQVSGMVPDAAVRALIADRLGEDLTATVERRGGAPERWDEAVTLALDLLPSVQTGVVRLEDNVLSVSGLVATRDDRDRIRALTFDPPDGFTVDLAVSLGEIARPLSFSARYEAGRLILAGNVPQVMVPAILAHARDRAEVSGTLNTSTSEQGRRVWPEVAFAALDALVLTESGAVSVAGGRLRLNGVATAEAQADIAERLGRLGDVVLVVTLDLPE
ncbi:hypothetical protein [Pseudaestuariivita atlantica]|uniref:BON domain-containing protein n=1 Tax=Pseudaestuariivita atlantica TaxID=1317121 RepID=A0A0L1JUB3_9RHOB|nr:hypothetical protein [Pseudaestuariivita atlantica]KNG94973.1 hypothetical protein ATO11_06310 [Pseudaestuariivita atlantica]